MLRAPFAFVAGLVVAVAVSFTIRVDGLQAVAAPQALPSEMVGSWCGVAQIFANWTTQRTLPVQIAIAPDGRVTGTIGDAALLNGHLETNRNAIERTLHWKTDWIVKGDLDGDVIKPERIHRASVMVPLDWIDDHFEGGVNTSGTHLGGKDGMWLAAGHLRLDRQR
jgi:hypothetical protein